MFWNRQQKQPEPTQTPPATPAPPPSSPPASLKEQIAAEADFLRKTLSEAMKIDLSFNPVCMMQIDHLIGLVLQSKPPPDTDRLIMLFGSYYGECLRRCYGGEWRANEQGHRYLQGIAGENLHAYPYNTVRDAIVDREPGKVFAAAKFMTASVFDAAYKRFYAEPTAQKAPKSS